MKHDSAAQAIENYKNSVMTQVEEIDHSLAERLNKQTEDYMKKRRKALQKLYDDELRALRSATRLKARVVEKATWTCLGFILGCCLTVALILAIR